MGRSPSWRKKISSSRDEALTAIKLLNDPTAPRRLEGFVVHMHLAYLYLLQAKAEKSGIEIRVKEASKRFKKKDGEPMTRDLGWLNKKFYEDGSPISKNIELFISIRNKIEHRPPSNTDNFEHVINGQIQSHLLNFENELKLVGGEADSLSDVLRFPLYLGGFTDEGQDALRKMTKKLPRDLRKLLVDFESQLPTNTINNPAYSLRLKVQLEKSNRNSDRSLIFTDTVALAEALSTGMLSPEHASSIVVNSNKFISVTNRGNLRPKAATEAIAAEVPFRFTLTNFTQACKILNVKPPSGSSDPHFTDERYCIWDEAFKLHVYTPAFVELLIAKVGTRTGFEELFGKEPQNRN